MPAAAADRFLLPLPGPGPGPARGQRGRGRDPFRGAYLREGAAEFGWNKRHPIGDKASGSIKTGMGVAICTWGGGGRGPSQTHCETASDGSVIMRLGTQDIGTGSRTLVAVITADSLGLRASQVKPEIGDTQYGISPLSGGSTTAASISPSIRVAAVKALDLLKEKVAPQLGVEPAALVAAGGRIHVRDNPARGLSWAEACTHIGPQPIAADGDWVPGLSFEIPAGRSSGDPSLDASVVARRSAAMVSSREVAVFG